VRFGVFDEATLKRIWSKVDKRGEDECCEWKRPALLGYGQFWFQGRTYRSHRITLGMVCVPPDDKPFACHKCDNRACVNPRHLYWGDASDNSRDCYSRHPTYRASILAHITRLNRTDAPVRKRLKLTPAQVDYIRQLLRAGYGHQYIADCYGVAKYTIFKIRHNITRQYRL